MILSDRDIKAQIAAGRIRVEPFEAELVQPASLDVCLGGDFYTFEATPSEWTLRPDKKDFGGHRCRAVDGLMRIEPGELILGTTIETVTLPDDVAAKFEGRSSLGRLGLMTHVTAGFVDPGFSGQITLELFNCRTAPIDLVVGMKIGQLCFSPLTSPAERPYGSAGLGSHYQRQSGATATRLHQNFYIHPSARR